MAKVKIGLVLDDAAIAQNMNKALQAADYDVAEPATTYRECFIMIKSEKPDVVLVDVQLKQDEIATDVMEKLKGEYNIPFIALTTSREIGDKLRDEQNIPYVVFIPNAEEQTTPQGRTAKPYNRGELYGAIGTILHQFAGVANNIPDSEEREHYLIKDQLFIKQGQNYQKIALEDIFYLETNDLDVNIYTMAGKMTMRDNIQKYLDLLGSKNFIRVHKNFAVNINNIDSISSDSLLIKDKEIPIGKPYHDGLMKLLEVE
jgi:DNA-binding LytR/AlgR family response regulator